MPGDPAARLLCICSAAGEGRPAVFRVSGILRLSLIITQMCVGGRQAAPLTMRNAGGEAGRYRQYRSLGCFVAFSAELHRGPAGLDREYVIRSIIVFIGPALYGTMYGRRHQLSAN